MGSDEARGAGCGDAWLSVDAVVVERAFDVRLQVAPGEVVAVLGPNGAGKSTLLSVIAGLIRPDSGRVRAGERMLLDTEAGTDVPVADRHVGMLAQDALLFNSLSVAENVEFGPRSQGLGKEESAAVARRGLAEVGAQDLAHRKPRKLSGGQEQRVAIARALAAGPQVLLLDEPMGSLDVAVAARVRSMLRRVLHERAETAGSAGAAVIVTHDVVDALTLADRIVVLDNGVVVDEGPVDRVLRAPRSAFAADLAGTNMVGGRAVQDSGHLPDEMPDEAPDVRSARSASSHEGAAGPGDSAGGGARGRRGGFGALLRGGRGRGNSRRNRPTRAVEADADAATAAVGNPAGRVVHGGTLHTIDAREQAVAVFSPRAVAVYRQAPHGSPRNAFPVTVSSVEARGDAIRVRGREATGEELMAEMTTSAARELALEAGDDAVFVVKASEVRVYPA